MTITPGQPTPTLPAGTAPRECPKKAAAVDEILARLDSVKSQAEAPESAP